MRIAAGVLMTIVGSVWLIAVGSSLSDIAVYYGNSFPFLVVSMSILAVFSITCGVFFLKRKYWKVCLASALLFPALPHYFLFQLLTHLPDVVYPGMSLPPPPLCVDSFLRRVGDSPSNIRWSQQERVAETSDLTEFSAGRTCQASATTTITMYTGDE